MSAHPERAAESPVQDAPAGARAQRQLGPEEAQVQELVDGGLFLIRHGQLFWQ
jgi:hypothetical protein